MAEETKQAGDNVLDRVMEPLKQASEALKDIRQRAGEHNQEVNLRLLEFAERNMTETLEALRAAARAKDLTEVLTIQGNFLRDQMTRSADQVREFTELMNKVGREALERVGERFGKAGAR